MDGSLLTSSDASSIPLGSGQVCWFAATPAGRLLLERFRAVKLAMKARAASVRGRIGDRGSGARAEQSSKSCQLLHVRRGAAQCTKVLQRLHDYNPGIDSWATVNGPLLGGHLTILAVSCSISIEGTHLACLSQVEEAHP